MSTQVQNSTTASGTSGRAEDDEQGRLQLRIGNGRLLVAAANVARSAASAFGVPIGRNGEGRLFHVRDMVRRGIVISRTLTQMSTHNVYGNVSVGTLIRQAQEKMRNYLRSCGVGLAVVQGTINTEDVALVWSSRQVYERARLTAETLRQVMPGGTDLRNEHDEAHMYQVNETGVFQNAVGYNVPLNSMPFSGESADVLIKTIEGLRTTTFDRMDNFDGETIDFNSKGVKYGGLKFRGLAGLLKRETLSIKEGDMEKFVLAVAKSLADKNGFLTVPEEDLEQVAADAARVRASGDPSFEKLSWDPKIGFHVSGMAYFTRVAIVQAYMYVATLNIDVTEILKANSNYFTITHKFYAAAKAKMMKFTSEKTIAVSKPAVPATWLYMFICIQYQKHVLKADVGDCPESGTIHAIKEFYAPWCRQKTTDPSDGPVTYVADNSSFEFQMSAGPYSLMTSQALYMTWYDYQTKQLAPSPAIAKSWEMVREKIRSVKLLIPFRLEHDKGGNITNYVNYSKDRGGHFFRRVSKYKMEIYATHIFNAFLTGSKGGSVNVVRSGHFIRECQGTFLRGEVIDSVKNGVVGMSSCMYTGGLNGVGGIKIKLKCTISPNIWNKVGSFPYAESTQDGMRIHEGVEQAIQSLYEANDADLRIKDGAVEMILGYDATYLTMDDDGIVCVVDGGEEDAISQGVKDRVESSSLRMNMNDRYPGADFKRNVYRRNERNDLASGITFIGTCAPDPTSDLVEGLIMTIPAGHIRHLHSLWIESGDPDVTFQRWVETAPMSVAYLGTLDAETLKYLKLAMPHVNPVTGLLEVPQVGEEKTCRQVVKKDGKIQFAKIHCWNELLAGNGANFEYQTFGLEGNAHLTEEQNSLLQSTRQEMCAEYSGLTMEIVTQFVNWLVENDEKILIEDLVKLAYELWYNRAMEHDGGLRELVGPMKDDKDFCLRYLKRFYEDQFVQVVARQGFERHTYGLSSHDVIMVRLALSTIVTLTTAETSTRSGLSIRDIEGVERSPGGPKPGRILLEASRRNYSAVLLRNSIIPSFELGGLSVYIATALDIGSLMTKKGPNTLYGTFKDLQPLLPKGRGQAGEMVDEYQNEYTYVNAITQYITATSKKRSGGRAYKESPNPGCIIGMISNSGLGAGSKRAISAVGTSLDDPFLIDQGEKVTELSYYDWSEGLGGDKMVKVSEAGEVIIGIDMVARQMLAIQTDFEVKNPDYRGQLAMVSTGMYTVYTGLIWMLGKEPAIMGRKVYVDSNVRFSSKLLRGRGQLQNLLLHGISKKVAEEERQSSSRPFIKEMFAPTQPLN